jgi:hypothetical protein
MRRCFLSALLLLPFVAVAQDVNDAGYGKKIREYTTEPFFLPPAVDHLPASKTVPTPEKFFGTIAGAPNVLHYSKALANYLRALEKTSKRIKVLTLGKSEEGREMVVAVVSDAANLARLDDYKAMNGRLADPRKLSEAEAEGLIKKSLPMYWCTGAMHAPESGPPEMLTELAYRLAVSEEPSIRTIRKNAIVMITPALDVDGRDRAVDVYNYRKKNPDKPPIPLLYWGKYVAHDDNRDGITLALRMSQALTKTWLDFHPQVMHDLHEAIPYLYISTGTGPYNPWLNPIVTSEWQEMAYEEVNALTKQGIPGVWTHGFYDGWAANYGFTVAHGHNAIGRFYETFSADGADTGIRDAEGFTSREWYRPNPPFPKVRWSIRNNVNLSQAALLVGLEKVAREKETFLRNFYLKSRRAVAKARTEGPAAWVFPADDPGRKRQAMLLRILQKQGLEVNRLDEAANVDGQTIARGSYVVRLDQPYSRFADMLLDTQYYKSSDPASYDDTGWTLGPLFDVRTLRIKDPAILDRPMTPVTEFGEGAANSPRLAKPLRIALVHTWLDTQNEGWARLAFDGLGIPYDYLSIQAIREATDLKAKYDLVLIPQAYGSAVDFVNGFSFSKPIAWRATPETPNLGGPDSTDDIRGGMDLSGVANLRRFVQEGGTLMCVGNAARLPVDFGLVSGVSVVESGGLRAGGGVYSITNEKPDSPLLKGYGKTLGAYFNGYSLPILDVEDPDRKRSEGPRSSGRGSLTDPDVIQGRPPYLPKAKPGDVPDEDPYKVPVADRPRVLLRFAKGNPLLSGMIENPGVLAGKPAVIDCPVGKGHIVLFSINPFWRGETVGSYQLVLNAAELLP